jgi:DUF1680 family protein
MNDEAMRIPAVIPFLLLTLGVSAQSPAVPNRAPLTPGAFSLLPLGSVKPAGWLQRQLRIQADGLTGHLSEFWPSLGPDSGWLGGSGESWERGPYFADGLLPLAYLLDDEPLKAQARRWVEWTLTHQRPDGSIGPLKDNGWWPRMVMLKVLVQYAEATADPRVEPLLTRYFAYQLAEGPRRPLELWARHRWADELFAVLWLYNRTGNPKLLELARLLHSQGYDWNAQFANFSYTSRLPRNQASQDTHVVNNAMALKTTPLWYLVAPDPALKAGFYRQLAALDRYHLQPHGGHSGDEHYAGLSPSQGTELCSIVEAMFSLETVLTVFADPRLGDRLEKLAYNPLPGTFDKTMWAHQYDQQANQVMCSRFPRDWTTNGPASNLFGLEPNFGCCTANFHQGWPKFVANLWMATPDQGLAAVAYGPSSVRSLVRGSVPVTITEDTEYPFRDTIRFTVTPSKPTRFPLVLRIPEWAAAATLTINGQPRSGLAPATFHSIDRTWKPGDTVVLRLPMPVRTTRWFHDSVALERGPLVFSLPIGEEWRKMNHHPQAPDWAVYPTTAWNYGLIDSPATVVERPLGDYPFSPEGAPVQIKVRGRRLPEWSLESGSAGEIPIGPVHSVRPLEDLTLIPYGAAKLRITAFPRLAE